MFNVLKNKLASFVSRVTHTVQQAQEGRTEQERPRDVAGNVEKKVEEQEKNMGEGETPEPKSEEPIKQVERPPIEERTTAEPKLIITESKAIIVEEKKQVTAQEQKPTEIKVEEKKNLAHEHKKEPVRKVEPKLSLATRARALVFNDVEIKENDVRGMFDELELSLLESDVAYGTAQAIIEDMRKRVVGMRVGRNEVEKSIKNAIRSSLLDIINTGKFEIGQERPFVVLFLGPNGAGKTTTIAKVARMLESRGLRCVLSASDTFRAAAIEQAEEHAKRLGVPLIKHKYGADPAAVAFDAINFARAHGRDVVLIDSAGRQETNKNLLDEMKKIIRIAKPHLKIFVGESLAGNAIVEQVKVFKEAFGVDGIILTKLDCDAKGGTVISISHETGVPILYVGTGEKYSDLREFDPQFIVTNILN